MKISIEKGTDVESAMKLISEFLNENYSDYPIIKNNMNVYITLKNSKEQICPDNEKEYVLTKGSVRDIFAEEKNMALHKRLNDWNGLVLAHIQRQKKLQNQIEKDIAYLNSAKEKNRKEENIIKRKRQYELNKDALNKQNEFVNKLTLLDQVVQDGRFITYYLKSVKGSSYKYNLEVAFIFHEINGYDGYFDYLGLHDGLPSYY